MFHIHLSRRCLLLNHKITNQTPLWGFFFIPLHTSFYIPYLGFFCPFLVFIMSCFDCKFFSNSGCEVNPHIASSAPTLGCSEWRFSPQVVDTTSTPVVSTLSLRKNTRRNLFFFVFSLKLLKLSLFVGFFFLFFFLINHGEVRQPARTHTERYEDW